MSYPENPTMDEWIATVRADSCYPKSNSGGRKKLIDMVGRNGLTLLLHHKPPPRTERNSGGVCERIWNDLNTRVRRGVGEVGIKGVDFDNLTPSIIKHARASFKLWGDNGGTLYCEEVKTTRRYHVRDKGSSAATSGRASRNTGAAETVLRDAKSRELAGATVVYPHEVYPLLRTCVDDEYDDDDEITPADAADLLSTFWSTHAPRGNSLHVEVKFLEFLQQRLACQRIQAWLVEQQSIVAQHELALRAKDKQWAPTVPPAADHDGAAVKGALLPPAPLFCRHRRRPSHVPRARWHG